MKFSQPSIQENIDIGEIRDGVVVLKDGSLRAVLAVSSINFDLKSDVEQEAITFAYQRFLNSLDFPIQILITSRKYDVKPYLGRLEEKKDVEGNELLRNQMDDYMNFVKELVGVSNIISKVFYVVVPFYIIESKKSGIFERISSSLNPKKVLYEKREEFETYKNQLFLRVGEIRELLSGTGVRMVPLNTQELIELFYNYYNPSEFEHVAVSPLEKIDVETH